MLDRRLLIVTGKGGVGRSAVTAALARARARRGERVLALALGAGPGLAAHLGAAELTAVPRTAAEGVRGSEVVPDAALDEYVRRRIGANPLRLASRVFRVLAHAVPGIRDIVLLGKVVFEATEGVWDAVVVDAPPAGQIDSTLRAPSVIESLVPSGTVHDEAARLRTVLQDEDQTEIVTVATPDELALSEAGGVAATADDLGLTRSRVLIANRVLEDPGFSSPPPEDFESGAAARLHLGLRSEQQPLLSAARAAVHLPLLFGLSSPAEIAAALADLVPVR
ncbi:MAG: ArsA-related P-loop ATPase [Acidimicrobiia bacterium]